MAGLVPAIHAVTRSLTRKVFRSGAACGRMLRIRLGMAETSPAMTAVEMNETARALASCLNSTLSALYERILAQDSSRPDDGYDATECAFRSTTIQARHP
jgi:hypothetical protein